MAERRPTAMTQSLSMNTFTGGGTTNSGAGATHGTFFLGRYRVVDEIGIGGMASVHLARADGPGGFQKWVAIKRIHPHLVEDDQFVHMFLDEARIAARISHANVAQVFELGEGDGTYWIAMEYLHGEPLREVMRSMEDGTAPRMGYEIAAKIIADAAEGLHSAHDMRGKNGELMGLVHRDVTPHNLFITYDGTVKVVDFGIAKVAGRLSSTRAGTLKGKLAYMSPEQVRGAEIDRRTDIFALGVVLWELTTGQRLFRTESDLETLEKVQNCVVPRPSSLMRDFPPALESIVMTALAKEPDRRFQTARDFSRALQQFLVRQGMLVGPEEVSGYMRSMFGDRIQRRNDHLRWAAEVTQTINIDEFRAQQGAEEANDVSAVTYASEVQSNRGGRAQVATPPASGFQRQAAPHEAPAPRPAAGQPAPAGFKQTMKLPGYVPSTPGAAAPLPSFSAPAQLPPPVPVITHEEDEEDENIATVVGPARELFGDNPMYSAPPPVQGGLVPPQVNSQGPGYPGYAQNAYGPPPAPGYPYPPGQGYAPGPTYPGGPPPAPGLAPQGQPPVDAAQGYGARDPTMQLPLMRPKKTPILPVVLGAIGLVAVACGGALIGLRMRDNDSKATETRGDTAKTDASAKPSADPAVSGGTTPPATAAPTAQATAASSGSAAGGSTGGTVPLNSLPDSNTPKPDSPKPDSPRPDGPKGSATTTPTADKKKDEPKKDEGSGFLTVVCTPYCDAVIVKGRNLGPSPVLKAPLPAGTHGVTLKKSGSPSKTMTATITAGQTTPLRVKMD
jgi:serine/threonine-protein kinase